MADHRAGRRVTSAGAKTGRGSRSSGTVGGKRKAVKPSRRATRSASPLPSIPALVGTAAVVAAAAGAVTLGSGSVDTAVAAGGFQKVSGQTEVLTSAGDVDTSALAEARQRAVSRDFARTARADADDDQLQAAAVAQFRQRNAALLQLAARAESHAAEVAENAWQLPLTSFSLSARFGECSSLWSSCHTGLDFSAPSGAPIHAVGSGVVTEVAYDGSYGNKTVVQLEDGTEIWYCHQSSFGVSVGETVFAGEVIGYVGSTGNSTGPHLHLEVHPGGGDAVDPYDEMVAHGLTF